MTECERPVGANFRIHLIYVADGMLRPLSFRQTVGAGSVTEAVRLVTRFIETAYESGFTVLSWTAENLDKPVHLKYVGGGFADEVAKQRRDGNG